MPVLPLSRCAETIHSSSWYFTIVSSFLLPSSYYACLNFKMKINRLTINLLKCIKMAVMGMLWHKQQHHTKFESQCPRRPKICFDLQSHPIYFHTSCVCSLSHWHTALCKSLEPPQNSLTKQIMQKVLLGKFIHSVAMLVTPSGSYFGIFPDWWIILIKKVYCANFYLNLNWIMLVATYTAQIMSEKTLFKTAICSLHLCQHSQYGVQRCDWLLLLQGGASSIWTPQYVSM